MPVEGSARTVHPEAIPSALEGSYSYHNHPTDRTHCSFSAEDVRFFFENGAAYSKASDYLYEYVMQRTPETPLAISPEMVYHRFEEIYAKDVLRHSYHETMVRLSKEYHFIYERVKLND